MAIAGQHVLGYSPDGKLFALINEQGILKIWDTETNNLAQEYTPNLHLSCPCSALTWVTISQHKKTKKARKSSLTGGSLYLALGTNTGGVLLYSYALGKIERSLTGEGHSGGVTSICSDDVENIYTCGEDCQIIVWSLTNEKQVCTWSVGNEQPHSIAYLSKSRNIVVGARQIRVYSLDTQELIQTFTGHTSEVTILDTVVVRETQYAVTASKMERVICLWKIGKKGGNKPASCTLIMEDIAHSLSCQVDEDVLKIASVTRSGVIHVFAIPSDRIKAEKPIKPKVTLQIAADNANVIEPIPAVGASLQHAAQNKILFGFGDKNFMAFEQVEPNFAEKLQVLVRTDPKKRFIKKEKKQRDLESTIKTISPLVNENTVDYKSGAPIPRKNLKTTEIPFELRLRNLNLNPGEQPQAQSKVQLLVQALHSKDASMLMMVLDTDNLKVIRLTLQKLPVQYVGSLVNELTLLMQKKRKFVEIAANWLKILVETHSSQLMALGADDLLEKFGPCIGIIEHRANCLMEISKLKGRLQLLVSQIKRNSDEDILNNQNTLVYEDNDTSESELEDHIMAKNPSDGEWEEDESSVEEMES